MKKALSFGIFVAMIVSAFSVVAFTDLNTARCANWTPTIDCDTRSDIGNKICEDVEGGACSAACVSNHDGTGVQIIKTECKSGKCHGRVCKSVNDGAGQDVFYFFGQFTPLPSSSR